MCARVCTCLCLCKGTHYSILLLQQQHVLQKVRERVMGVSRILHIRGREPLTEAVTGHGSWNTRVLFRLRVVFCVGLRMRW